VQITVELDRSVRWQVRRAQAKNAAAPASLVLDLEGALPDARIRDGARVADSPLSAVRVGAASGEQTRLFFDFVTLASYETRVEQDPFKIILDVRARDAKTQQRADRTSETTRDKKAQAAGAASSPEALVLPAVAPLDLALQLGLTVQSVFLDVGHGGKDPGTGHNGLVEKEVALDIARRVGKLLRNRGIEVQFSRENDRYLSLTDRTRMAGKAGADLFVSLHVNASADPQVSGFETYYLDLASSKEAARLATLENAGSDKKMGELTAILADFMLSARTQESRQLARTLQRSVMSRLSKQRFVARDGGVKSAPLHVLIGTGMPAVLVELGYCSNKEEARRLGSAAYRQSLAEGIAEGILAYRDMLLRKQTVDVTRDTRRS
jgi:N-acetylmuramoyl-L-alanine amidase